jgi:EAL domain-containing protein (putative c-di-GMP-specific phosphodiesterase class I)
VKHLEATGRQTKQSSADSDYLGIIYLSWSFPEIGGNGHASATLAERWRAFAERELQALQQSTELFSGFQWMNDDLFVQLRLAGERQDALEEWLLELAYKQIEELRERYLSEHSQDDRQMMRDRLHVGIAIVPSGSHSTDSSRWYEAMKKALVHGQSAHSLERSLKRLALNRLLEFRQITPVYQPIVSLRDSNHVFGYEALARTVDRTWFTQPAELFWFAEQQGLTYTLDRLAREKAIDGCTQLGKEQKLFINVMAQIMEDPGFLPGQTLSLLEQRGLSPHNVVFEITERSSIADFDSVKRALEHYRMQGYQIAIDDVGAGYSSLQSIVELRPDYLKVDRSIIQNIHQDEIKEHILYTLLELAAKLDIAVIAEGIEEEAELVKVLEMGVHYAQGYLLGRPAAFG